jgi:branched-chain amino acid transport system permease protein
VKRWFFFLAIVLFLIPILTQDGYYIGLSINCCIYIVLTLTFMLMMQVGLLSLGQCAFYGIGAYLCTVLVMKAGLSYWVALPLGALITMVIMALIFIPILRTRGLFFAIMTLCLSAIVAQIVGHWEYLGGHTGIIGIPRPTPIGPIDFTSRTHYYFLASIIMFISIVVMTRLSRSHFGITLRLIRDNESLAEHIGINPFWYKLTAISIASFFAALVGGVYAPYTKYINPEVSSMWDSLFVQIYGITGGLNYPVGGAIVGTVILKILPELMRVTQMYQPMIFGIVLILVVLFLPHGLMGLPGAVKHWRIGGRGETDTSS